eukprot:3793452-Amphidinium_carterae.1
MAMGRHFLSAHETGIALRNADVYREAAQLIMRTSRVFKQCLVVTGSGSPVLDCVCGDWQAISTSERATGLLNTIQSLSQDLGKVASPCQRLQMNERLRSQSQLGLLLRHTILVAHHHYACQQGLRLCRDDMLTEEQTHTSSSRTHQSTQYHHCCILGAICAVRIPKAAGIAGQCFVKEDCDASAVSGET